MICPRSFTAFLSVVCFSQPLFLGSRGNQLYYLDCHHARNSLLARREWTIKWRQFRDCAVLQDEDQIGVPPAKQSRCFLETGGTVPLGTGLNAYVVLDELSLACHFSRAPKPMHGNKWSVNHQGCTLQRQCHGNDPMEQASGSTTWLGWACMKANDCLALKTRCRRQQRALTPESDVSPNEKISRRRKTGEIAAVFNCLPTD